MCRHTEQLLATVLADLGEGHALRATLTVAVGTATNLALTALCVSGMCAASSAAAVQAGVALPSLVLSALEATLRVAAAATRATHAPD